MVGVVNIKGDIVDNSTAQFYEYFGMDAVSPSEVSQQLDDGDDEIEVNIASNGGDLFAASEIYTMLKNDPRNVTVNIQGLAASSASIIAMAGDEINISPTAQMMIHQVWSNTQGNADDMRTSADSLDSADQAVVNAYEAKTGLDRDSILSMMQQETWMDAQEAVDKGFADKIMFVDEKQPQLVNATHSIPSRKAINKFLTMMAKSSVDKPKPVETKAESKPTLREQKLAFLFGKETSNED
ncbi:head maturation protease, ClpP-related [Limosilactobacillus fermentum]|uniref:head maturation protease, ClpP-related n=1 Tax=Limosilactobacillus fermentum TaxID=1613 RepID=UPI00070BD97F|nr:head maturation protease, ClpP-related [Limosilactobacillus fermentum]